MKPELQLSFTSKSPAATKELAAFLADKLKGGEVVFLRGPIGAGKTEFVKAVCERLGAQNSPVSASFGLMKEYEGKKLKIYHIDLFRLEECEVFNLGFEEMFYDEKAVVFAEWPDVLNNIFDKDRLEIDIALLKGNLRKITFSAGGRVSALLLNKMEAFHARGK